MVAFVTLSSADIETLLLFSQEEEPDQAPHSWCLDWTLRAEEYLLSSGIPIRPTRYLDQYNLRAGEGPHLWVELRDGTIVDGTVGQYCRDDLWILPPGHPLRSLYLYAGERGEAVASALRGPHPLVANFGAQGSMGNLARNQLG